MAPGRRAWRSSARGWRRSRPTSSGCRRCARRPGGCRTRRRRWRRRAAGTSPSRRRRGGAAGTKVWPSSPASRSARLDGEAGGLWVHTTHLSYREHEGLWREAQVQFVDELLTEHDNGNPRVVMGDFNTVPESDEIRFLTGAHTLGGRRVAYQDAWAAVNQDRPGHTWARANDYTERMHWLRRDRRLDYIFVSPVRRDRRATVHGAAVVLDQPEVRPDGERIFASDHFGVTA